MNIGTLNIEIATNIARIQADMQAAKQAVGGAMKDVESYVNAAKSAIVGLIGIGTIDAFKGMILSGIEGKARLYDLSIQTGMTVEALGALGKVAKLSNTALDTVAAASNKLSKALVTTNEDSKGAASGIKALGLNFNSLRDLQPEQQMLVIAKAMDGFRDGTGKSAVAMELFGKTGAQLLPFMAELAAKTDLTSKQTTEAAKQAKEFEDNLIKLKTASEEWKRQIVNDLLPGLTFLTTQMVEAKTAGEKFAVVLGNIRDNLGFSAMDRQRKDLENLNLEVNAASGRMSMFIGIQNLLPDAMKNVAGGAIDYQRKKLEDLTRQAGAASEALKKNADVLSGVGGGPMDTRHFPGKPELRPANAGAGPGPTAKDDYTPLIRSIDEKIAADLAEYESVTKLTEGQKLQAKVFADIDGGYIKLTLSQKLNTDARLQALLAGEKLNEAKKREADYLNQAGAENVKYVEGLMSQRDALEANRKAQQDLLATYGMTSDELYALETAKLRDVAASKLQTALGKDQEWQRDEIRLLEQQATALRDTADLRDQLAAKGERDRNDPLAGAQRSVKNYLDQIKQAGNDTEQVVNRALGGMEDAFVSLATTGKANFHSMADAIIADIIRIQIRQLATQAAGGAGGGGGWAGAAASLIGKFFSGGNTGLNSAGDGYYSNEGRNFGGPRAGGGGVGANTDYLVGEKGPEILRMGSQAGTVIPNGGGGSRPVMVNITNNGQPVQARSSQRETSEGTVIDMVLDAVAADMAGGGKVHDATQRRFGLNPGGTTPRY